MSPTPPEAKWLRFERVHVPTRKTETWIVYSKEGASILGVVQWFGRWRRYTFEPAACTEFEPTCLRDLAAFLEWMQARWKEARS